MQDKVASGVFLILVASEGLYYSLHIKSGVKCKHTLQKDPTYFIICPSDFNKLEWATIVWLKYLQPKLLVPTAN